MKRRHFAWLLFFIGACMAGAVGATLFYQGLCPDASNIETVIPNDADIAFTLERTGCFGACPSYKLTIDGRGRVVYNGRSHVRQEGQHESQMSQEDVQRLISAFETQNFYALEIQYHRAANPICDSEDYSYMTDAPHAMLGLSVNGSLTEIDHYHGLRNAPSKLTELENLVDELAQSGQWIK